MQPCDITRLETSYLVRRRSATSLQEYQTINFPVSERVKPGDDGRRRSETRTDTPRNILLRPPHTSSQHPVGEGDGTPNTLLRVRRLQTSKTPHLYLYTPTNISGTIQREHTVGSDEASSSHRCPCSLLFFETNGLRQQKLQTTHNYRRSTRNETRSSTNRRTS